GAAAAAVAFRLSAPTLLHPRDEQPATGMVQVRHEAGPAPLKLIERQMDGLWIEFRVVQERQLTQPPELAVAIGETACEPIRHADADEAFTATCVENHRMKRAERRDLPRHGWRPRRLAQAHVEE